MESNYRSEILNGKVSKEAGTVSFEVRIPRKKQRIIIERFHQKINRSK